MKKEFVIFLTNVPIELGDLETSWSGYWTGKSYVFIKRLFAVVTCKNNKCVKKYSSRKRAERGLEACLKRGYEYVVDGRVEEVTEND